MFLHSDYVVKAVMILLLLASLWSWAIIFNKLVALSRPQAQGARGSRNCSGRASRWTSFISSSPPATIIPWRRCSSRRLREWRRGFRKPAGRAKSRLPGIKERIDKAMNVTILRETDGIERQLGFLATVGSVSPFIGLFGTVWGIMNSFSRHRRAP